MDSPKDKCHFRQCCFKLLTEAPFREDLWDLSASLLLGGIRCHVKCILCFCFISLSLLCSNESIHAGSIKNRLRRVCFANISPHQRHHWNLLILAELQKPVMFSVRNHVPLSWFWERKKEKNNKEEKKKKAPPCAKFHPTERLINCKMFQLSPWVPVSIQECLYWQTAEL